ncbi:pyocin knob domain-containing protein [Pseudomonas fluorescens]|uniref:Uncharacterized protein n=1 Tax=Pseudomonas fluorescens TaxID=294 RepID=A0A5E7AZH9_PSEFL|nr:pyocin knob domain-containing protein [Pseudomonas fluorescens]VVN83740.1 hypothetical protein PS704_01303 [Pseudomonas fluorescens]
MPNNTGNAMPSKDPRDLYDNATNFDKFSNGSEKFYPDRFGVSRLSLAGYGMAFDESQVARDVQFQAFLVAAGYVWIGDYAAGITFTARNQYTQRSGSTYRVAPATVLPYTLTGTWATDQPKLVLLETSGTILSQLAASTGAGLIGTAEAITVQAALDARLRSNISAASTNLNTLYTSASIGVYRQSVDASATTALNYPVAGVGGTLEVYVGVSNLAMQEFTTKDLRKFIRWCSSATGPVWTAWREISPPLGGSPGQVFTNVGAGAGAWANPSFQAGTYRKLRISYPNVFPTTSPCTMTADYLVLANATGETLRLQNWSLSALQGSEGSSGKLDTGVWASTTQYSLYAIYNPTTGTRDLIWSKSTTAPLLPSGYTFFMRIGSNLTVSTSQSARFCQGDQVDNRFSITRIDLAALANGAVGTWSPSAPTFAAISISSQVPDTAIVLLGQLTSSAALGTTPSAGAIMVAPTASFTGPSSGNPGPFSNNVGTSLNAQTGYISTVTFEMTLVSMTIYAVGSSAGVSCRAMGWVDSL